MAIQLDLQTTQYGIGFQGAYFRILKTFISREENPAARFSVTIDVVGYAGQPQNSNQRDIEWRQYRAPMDQIEIQSGDNFLARCYEWVMAQPDMVGAIAV
jgi:hypothetical protein